MKKLLLSLTTLAIAGFTYGQTTHQVCVSEITASGPPTSMCVHTSGVFTPSSLNIAIGDMIQFTTFTVNLSGYTGTNHTIRFDGGSPQDVTLPISVITPLLTTVTTPAFNTAGVFSMECTNFNHCILATTGPCTGYTVTVGTSTEIEEAKMANELSIYPNPTNGIVNINLLPIINDNPKVYLVDVLGKTIDAVENNLETTVSFDLADYNKGTYFIKIETDKENFNYPVIYQ
jgi:hypothetical protein